MNMKSIYSQSIIIKPMKQRKHHLLTLFDKSIRKRRTIKNSSFRNICVISFRDYRWYIKRHKSRTVCIRLICGEKINEATVIRSIKEKSCQYSMRGEYYE